jgi:predicted membrane protein
MHSTYDYSKGDFTQKPEAGYPPNVSASDFLNSTSVFGGIRKNIISKNFQGGEITTFMGGADINLSQADIQGRVVLDVTQVMGGTRIIVPPHWDVVSEVAAVFGGVEDKRFLQANAINPNKVLIIRGTSFMGGIDIRSF